MLNRYEASILNTSAQACELMTITAHPSVGFHLDTFHMSMEEDSLGDAPRLAGKHLFHLHASESQRGTPGSGNVAWDEVAQALRDIDCKGFATIESFNPQGRLAPMASLRGVAGQAGKRRSRIFAENAARIGGESRESDSLAAKSSGAR